MTTEALTVILLLLDLGCFLGCLPPVTFFWAERREMRFGVVLIFYLMLAGIFVMLGVGHAIDLAKLLGWEGRVPYLSPAYRSIVGMSVMFVGLWIANVGVVVFRRKNGRP